MSDVQRMALAVMGPDFGAVLVPGLGWVWREDVRRDEQIARAVLVYLIRE